MLELPNIYQKLATTEETQILEGFLEEHTIFDEKIAMHLEGDYSSVELCKRLNQIMSILCLPV